MNKGLKNKGLGSWFCLAAALVALITGIVFLLTQATAAPLGHSGTMAGVVLLVGAAASLVFFFVSVPFSALIQAVIYNIALYLVVVQLYFVFADVINHVTFAGGNAGLCVFYMVGTFIACLLSVIACFCKQTKTGEAKATGKQFAAAGAVVVVAAVCVGGFSLQSSSLPSNGDAEVAPDAAQTSADGPVMNYNDNEFTSKTLDDLVAIPQETWEAKEPNGEVAYFFEGQYTEGFSTIVDPACLDMYCYTDGSMWGSFSGPSTSVGGDSISHVYGYWYNYDENGEKNFVIHLLGNQDADGTVRPTDVDGGADADIFVFDTDHGAYSMEASLSYGVMGGAFTRNINIYGQPYAPAKSLTIDASNLRTFYTGDTFNPGELVVTATRANGAEESIWGGRLTFTGYDSDTAGTKTVTASFLGATATFEVQVEDLVTEQYTGSYELVQGETPGDDIRERANRAARAKRHRVATDHTRQRRAAYVQACQRARVIDLAVRRNARHGQARRGRAVGRVRASRGGERLGEHTVWRENRLLRGGVSHVQRYLSGQNEPDRAFCDGQDGDSASGDPVYCCGGADEPAAGRSNCRAEQRRQLVPRDGGQH